LFFVLKGWRENRVSIDARRLFYVRYSCKRSPLPGAKLSLAERAGVQ